MSDQGISAEFSALAVELLRYIIWHFAVSMKCSADSVSSLR